MTWFSTRLTRAAPFWSPANEMERNAEAVTIAASLYQPTSVSIKDEFFYRTPGANLRPSPEDRADPSRVGGMDGG